MSMDISVFLPARWDEIERIAQAAGGKSWHVAHDAYDPQDERCAKGECWHRRVEGDDITIYDEGGHDEDQAAHIALHDPASVLADIASKWAILALHCPDDLHYPQCVTCADKPHDVGVGGEIDQISVRDSIDWPCPTLRALLVPFKSHPDFDPAWTAET